MASPPQVARFELRYDDRDYYCVLHPLVIRGNAAVYEYSGIGFAIGEVSALRIFRQFRHELTDAGQRNS